jgi:hypothetical protein
VSSGLNGTKGSRRISSLSLRRPSSPLDIMVLVLLSLILGWTP